MNRDELNILVNLRSSKIFVEYNYLIKIYCFRKFGREVNCAGLENQ